MVDSGWLISWITATDIARKVFNRSAWNSIRSRRAISARACVHRFGIAADEIADRGNAGEQHVEAEALLFVAAEAGQGQHDHCGEQDREPGADPPGAKPDPAGGEQRRAEHDAQPVPPDQPDQRPAGDADQCGLDQQRGRRQGPRLPRPDAVGQPKQRRGDDQHAEHVAEREHEQRVRPGRCCRSGREPRQAGSPMAMRRKQAAIGPATAASANGSGERLRIGVRRLSVAFTRWMTAP